MADKDSIPPKEVQNNNPVNTQQSNPRTPNENENLAERSFTEIEKK